MVTKVKGAVSHRGVSDIDVSGGVDVTLTEDQALKEVLYFTGTLTADINVIVPDTPVLWLVVHSATGGDITVKTASGAGVLLTPTDQKQVRTDGTDVVSVTEADGTVAQGILDQATLSADFVGQTYEAYEGITFGPTQRPFEDFFTFTRASDKTGLTRTGTVATAITDQAVFPASSSNTLLQGLSMEPQRTNELQYSENFDNAVWTKGNTFIAPDSEVSPDGSLTADAVIENNTTNTHTVGQAFSATSGLTYTGTFYLKDNGVRFGAVWFGGLNAGVEFDLELGVAREVTGFNSLDSFSISQVGDGFHKITITHTASASLSATFTVYLLNSYDFANRSYLGDGVSGLYVWGAQLEQGSFPTSYTPSTDSFTSRSSTATFYDSAGVLQTAAIDVARDDAYGYLDGVLYPIGLLLEGAATNQQPESENFAAGNWSTIGASVSSNTDVAPDGATTADTITEDGSSGEHVLFDNATALPASTHVVSAFVKNKVGSRFPVLRLNTGTGGEWAFAVFDLSGNGSVVSQQDDGTNFSLDRASIDKEGDYFRLQATITTNAATSAGARLALSAVSNPTPNSFGGISYVGDGTSAIVGWGAQVEQNNYATSYIPTAASTVTRSADVSSSAQTTREADSCVRTLGDEYKSSEGTLYIETDARNGDVVATMGSVTITADADGLKKYATTYTSDPSATQIVLGEGVVRDLKLFAEALSASEITTITA